MVVELGCQLWFRWDNWYIDDSYETYFDNIDAGVTASKVYIVAQTVVDLILNYFLITYLFLG